MPNSRKRKYGQATYMGRNTKFVKVPKASLKPRSEIKHKDYLLSFVNITGGAVAPVSAIGEGTDSTDRIGRRIALKNCQVKLSVYSGGAGNPAETRVVLFRAVGPLGAFADYLTDASSPVNPDRAKVVLDCMQVVTADHNNDFHIDQSINLKSKMVKYTTDTATSDQDGQLSILIAYSPAGTAPVINGWIRVWFYDV